MDSWAYVGGYVISLIDEMNFSQDRHSFTTALSVYFSVVVSSPRNIGTRWVLGKIVGLKKS